MEELLIEQATINNMSRVFNIKVGGLLAALKKAKEVVSAKPQMPILENVLFRVNGDSVAIVATDLLVTIEVAIDIENPTERYYSFLLPFDFLYKILQQVTVESITITLSDTELGKAWRQDAKISALHDEIILEDLAQVEDYPAMPVLPPDNSVGVGSDLIEWLEAAIDTCGTDKIRSVLQNIYLEINGNTLTIASTNAHVLMEKLFIIESDKKAQLLIDTRIAKALKGFKNASISWSDTHLAFINEQIKIIATLGEDKYPDYRAVIPESKVSMSLFRNELLGKLEQLSLTKSPTTIYFRKEIGTMVMEAWDTDYGRKITCRIEVDYYGEADLIMVNAANLLLLIDQVDYTMISLCITAANRPIVIKAEADPTYRALAMPTVEEYTSKN